MTIYFAKVTVVKPPSKIKHINVQLSIGDKVGSDLIFLDSSNVSMSCKGALFIVPKTNWPTSPHGRVPLFFDSTTEMCH